MRFVNKPLRCTPFSSLREYDVPALDLLAAEAHQLLAMRAVDRKLAGDRKLWVRAKSGETGFLECNQPGAGRISAPHGQIPFGCVAEIVDRGVRDLIDLDAPILG